MGIPLEETPQGRTAFSCMVTGSTILDSRRRDGPLTIRLHRWDEVSDCVHRWYPNPAFDRIGGHVGALSRRTWHCVETAANHRPQQPHPQLQLLRGFARRCGSTGSRMSSCPRAGSTDHCPAASHVPGRNEPRISRHLFLSPLTIEDHLAPISHEPGHVTIAKPSHACASFEPHREPPRIDPPIDPPKRRPGCISSIRYRP